MNLSKTGNLQLVVDFDTALTATTSCLIIQESPPQFENWIMARVYVRSITRSTMYQKAPFC